MTPIEITDSLYKLFGTDSGILFGIKERHIVENIVEFTATHLQPSHISGQGVKTSGVKEGTTYEIINNSDKPMTITLPQISSREAELEKCLGELVFLKDLKDNYGKTAYYIVNMPAAWDKAKSLLNPDKTDL